MPVGVADLICFFGPPQASRAESPLSPSVLRVSEVRGGGGDPPRLVGSTGDPSHSTLIVSVGPPVPPINPPTPIAEVGPAVMARYGWGLPFAKLPFRAEQRSWESLTRP